MPFHFLRKTIAETYVPQLTVTQRVNLIFDKNYEIVSVSCDVSTLTL